MTKLCCIFNTPSLYRESIYRCIEGEYDCDWYFEDTNNKLKTFDTSQFNSVSYLHARTLGPFYWVNGILKLLRKKEYKQYLMMGHSRNLSTLCFLLIKTLFFPHKKAYLWTHGLYGKESCLEYLWKKMLLGLADELMIYGDYACSLMKEAGFNPKKLHAIHNSLSYDVQLQLRKQMEVSNIYKNHFGNNNSVIVFIGRLTTVKKLHMLVQAIALLKKRDSLYNVAFIGDGSEMAELKRLSKNLGIESQIWFYGACYDERTNAELIYNADLCVAPGNIGLTAIHVLMFGCPVITHDNFSYQMPEFEVVKPNKTGNFFKKDNLESMADKIDAWFATNKNLRERVRKECYKEIDTKWNPKYQMKILQSVIE